MILSTYDQNDRGPQGRFTPCGVTLFKGGSKSSSQQSSTTTTKDNSAVLEDTAINATDGSVAGRDGAIVAGGNIGSLSIIDGGAVSESFQFAEFFADRGFGFGSEALDFAGNTQGSANSFASDAQGSANSFALDAARRAYEFAEGVDEKNVGIINANIEANRQLTDKVITGILETAEPETTDIAKFSTGALVIAGLGAAYLFTRKKAS